MSESRNSPLCGIRSLILLVIAGMVGAGVFTTSGFTLASVGSPARVMVCWAVGAMIAVCGAIAYGRLAQLIPESGGEYLYLSRFVHPFAGFLAGWVSLTAGFSGAIALAALTFEHYAMPESWRPDWLPADVLAVAVIAIFGHIHGTLVRTGIRVQNAVVVVQVMVLIAFLAVTGWNAPTHDWHADSLSDHSLNSFPLLNAMAISVVWISLSFAGFNAAIYVASESADAEHAVPKAILIGTIVVGVLYLVLNLTFVTSAPAETLAGEPDVAAVAARALGGIRLETLVRIAVAVGALSSVSGMVLTGPRVYQKMADDGVFPSAFSGPRGIRSSVLLQCLLAVGLIVMHHVAVNLGWIESSLRQLLTFLGATLSLSAAGCVATLFLPNVRQKNGRTSIMTLGAAGIFVAATLAAIVLMIASGQGNVLGDAARHFTGTAIVLVTGSIAWWMTGRKGDG